MAQEDMVHRYSRRVGYTSSEQENLRQSKPCVRHITNLAKAAFDYSIEAEVVKARHCNSGYSEGDAFVLDADGNLISKLCPKRLCVYLLSQLAIPVALINERLSEELEPNAIHFMKYVRCPDVGVDCSGYGEVMLRVQAVPRAKYAPSSREDP